ncbi:hypothetical protein OEZ85_000496 [Tetradesmus obliquus]|uniref:Molybdate-anion transporter n=1 Tax=Tetradesmus obliquus TaxID=3088 RepID=A0ABY8ULJ0_TETOB|nr:hypothetical protein OEZ85_000496 [Tetradesmus obliquus]
MELIYIVAFVLFAVPAAVLEYTENACFGLWERKTAAAHAQNGGYLQFRNNYVLIFSLMMAGDWLQGPYVYHLYEHYGFSVRDIGRLFIMGFGSSAVFGTVAGAMADRRGRKRAALLYVATYSASCLTKHSASYWVLMVGRLLGGIATSLLFSAFEAWAVAAHNSNGFSESLLGDLFTKAVFLGNGVMAIASGLLGNFLVEDMRLGPVAPFDAAIAVLLLGGLAIQVTWEENYGDKGGGQVLGQFQKALQTIRQDPRVSLLGASQALFEASMYTFVFLWTPALSPRGQKLPHGFIFATFMTASMVGTAAAGRLLRSCRLERLMQAVFWCSAVSLAVPVPFHMHMAPAAAMDAMLMYEHEHAGAFNSSSSSSSSSSRDLLSIDSSSSSSRHHAAAAAPLPDIELPSMADSAVPGAATAAAAAGAGLDTAGTVQLLAFCGFEVLIGMFWPSMMTLRAKYVPEEQRSTIINLFRVPLNLFVCIILWKVSDFP